MRKHRFDNTHASAVLVATLWSVDLLSHEVKVAVRHLFRPSDKKHLGDLPGLGLAGGSFMQRWRWSQGKQVCLAPRKRSVS